MSPPQNLPEILQAKLKLGLFNWGKRTLIWTVVLGFAAAIAPGLRFILIGWLLFSALSLAALLLGLKLAKSLKAGASATFPTVQDEPRDVGGTRPETAGVEDDHPQHQTHTGRNAVGDEIIEIEAEVMPPDRR